MPSPRPTRLQPGDRCWWPGAGVEITGTVDTVMRAGLELRVIPDPPARGVEILLPEQAHPLHDLQPDVLGHAEVLKLLGISAARLAELRAQIDFPAARELACGPVFDIAAIKAWDLDRKNDRAGKRTRVLASFRKLSTPRKPASVYAVAKSTGISYTTCRRHLLATGAIQPKETT